MSSAQAIGMEGACTIRQVRDRHDTIRSAMERGAVDLDLSGVTTVDITFLQLLASAARTAARRGTSFRLLNVPGEVASGFVRAGLAFDAAGGRLLAGR